MRCDSVSYLTTRSLGKKKTYRTYVLFLTPKDNIGGEGGPSIHGADVFGGETCNIQLPVFIGGGSGSSSSDESIFFFISVGDPKSRKIQT